MTNCNVKNKGKLADGYKLKWEDDFNGEQLNTADWNYELHEPGWVNEEWQEYVKSEDNVYVKDSNLVIQAIKSVDEKGNAYYTSGRISTQGKHDYLYGRFEARAKVPEGKGFLPAFWLMPTDEGYYGQWPKCGEIDVMEVLGDKTNITHSTLHFGEPHTQRQKTYTLPEGKFSDDFHVYAVEWEPGELRFYVDDDLFYTENDWFSKRPGFGEKTYPAPYDQPFYLLLNLAVGGSWVGYPDETTEFGDNARLVVDYVRVYQKDSYNTVVEKPKKEAKSEESDETGNDSINGGFAKEEKGILPDGNYVYNGAFDEGNEAGRVRLAYWDWDIDKCSGASVSVTNDAKRELKVVVPETVETPGQVVVSQNPVAIKGGNNKKYVLRFEAYADRAKTIQSTIAGKTFVSELTTDRTEYSYEFVPEEHLNGSELRFLLGEAGTTYIDNVSIKEDRIIVNGDFFSGMTGYEVYVADDAKVSRYVIDSLKEDYAFTIDIEDTADQDWKIQLKQNNIKLEKDKWYQFGFKVKSTMDRQIMYALQRDGSGDNNWTAYSGIQKVNLLGEYQSFSHTFKMNGDTDSKTILSISMGAVGGTPIRDKHTIAIDNITLEETEVVEE